MSFQIHALPESPFVDLFSIPDSELAKRSARRMVVDANPGFPCRVSLADAEVGETVILVNFEHQPNDTPYRSTHAIFVREGVEQVVMEPGEVPEVLRIRLLSVRAFDKAHQMIDADVVDGQELKGTIERLFENPNIAYVHLHNARPGCFSASVTRV